MISKLAFPQLWYSSAVCTASTWTSLHMAPVEFVGQREHLSSATSWLVNCLHLFDLSPYQGFPGGTGDKESVNQCRRCRFSLWVKEIPCQRKQQPFWHSCLGNPMARAVCWGRVYGVTESDTTKRLSTASPVESKEGWLTILEASATLLFGDCMIILQPSNTYPMIVCLFCL